MKKRILIFSLAYYPHVGGAEIAVKEITDRISDIEFEMITMRFSREEPGEERLGNILIHRVGANASYLSKILFVPRAAHKARSIDIRRFDALWAIMTYMLFPIALLRLSGVSTPYMLTLQDGDPFERVFERWFIRPFSPLLRWGFCHASVIQAISTFLGKWSRIWGFEGPLEIVPNGVDLGNFSRAFSENELTACRQGAGKKDDMIFLISTSRLARKNALDVVIRALPLLSTRVHFLILGTGPEEQALRRLAREKKVSDQVQFLGYVGHEDMPKYLRISDIFVRPSRSEGMGSSFIEAMAAGLPVIATREGGLKDFITSEVSWPVPPEAPGAIAQAVGHITGNPAHTAQVVARAKALVSERYDWGMIAKEMRQKVFALLV